MLALIPLIGALCALLVLFFVFPDRRKAGVVADLYSVDAARSLSALNPRSLEYRLLAAGINLKPLTFRLLCGAAALAGLLAAWLVLPGLPALVVAGILFYLPNAWLDEKVKSRGHEIERVMPVAVGRIAAGLRAGGAIPDVLQEVAESLAIEGPNPLTPELLLSSAEMRSKDRLEALDNLAARSPSVSLANLAYLLEGYITAGGSAYGEVLMDISQRIQQILVARNRAVAKAGDALVSTRVLPAVLFLVILYLSGDPLMADALKALPVQIALGLALAAMVAGYFVMRSMIMEAV